MKKKISLVLLSFNEIEGVTELVPILVKNQSSLKIDEIFAVDGGSTDGTLEVYAKYNIRVVKQKSRGRGEAMRLAHRDTDADFLVFFSPDGNEDWKDIQKFAEYFEHGSDLVIASRMMRGARNEEDIGVFRFRKWANNAFNLMANLFFRRVGKYVTDSINGFRGMRRGLLDELGVDAVGYTVEYQMTMRSFRKKLKITEFPTHEGQRIGGESKAPSIPTGIRFLKCLARECAIGTREAFKDRPWHWAILLGLTLRLFWVLSYQPKPISDFEMYWGFAQDFSNDFFRNAAPGYSLGYPYLLAILLKLGFSHTGILITQAILGAWVVLYLCNFLDLTLSRTAAWMSALLLSLSPSLIFYSSIVGTEVFSMVVVLVATIMFLKHYLVGAHFKLLLLAGALIGFSATMRSALLYIPLFYLMAAWLGSSLTRLFKLKSAGVFLGGWLIIVLAYCSWSKVYTGEFRISAKHGSQMFWLGTLSEAAGVYRGDSLREAEANKDLSARDEVYFAEGLKNISENPIQFITLGYQKLRVSFGSLGSAIWWNFEVPETELKISPPLFKFYSHCLTKYQRVIQFLIALSLISGIWFFRKRVDGSFFLVWMVSASGVLYLAVISFATIGADRFQYPFIPLFVLFGVSTPLWGVTIERILLHHKFKGKSQSRTATAQLN